MTSKEIENRLYDFLTEKMYTEDAPEIEQVRRFEGYLCTRDNGMDGTQIRLTIQAR